MKPSSNRTAKVVPAVWVAIIGAVGPLTVPLISRWMDRTPVVTIQGYVQDMYTGELVQKARIDLTVAGMEFPLVAFTDEDGRYRIEFRTREEVIPARLQVTAPNYAPLQEERTCTLGWQANLMVSREPTGSA